MGRTRSVALMGVPIRGGGISPLTLWQSQLAKYGGPGWDFQETSGDVAAATNEAAAVGRDVVIDGDFAQVGDWTEGANWTIGGGNATHAAGAVEALSQDGIAAAGKAWRLTFTVSNVTAGSVTPAIGASGTARSTNDTFVEDIDATSADLDFVPTTDFDGNIDDVTLTQLNILASTDYPGGEELTETNGVMDAGNWTPGESAALTNPSAIILKVARNIANNPNASQNSVHTVGRRYLVSGIVRSDGNSTPRILVGGATVFTGTTSTSNQPVSVEYVATSANIAFQVLTTTGTEFSEFEAFSITEVNPLNGDITGATVGVTIGPAGLLASSYDATNDFTNLYSAEHNSMFTPLLGSWMVYAQVPVGVWTDNTLRVLLAWYVDANNHMRLAKVASNKLQWDYRAGGVLERVELAATPTTPFLIHMTWDKAGVGMRAFYNGVQTGANTPIAGTWVGNFLSTQMVVGALTTAGNAPWSGKIALVNDYRAVVSDADILDMAKVLGVA